VKGRREGERGRSERERRERGKLAPPFSGQWPPAAVLAAGEANRERGRGSAAVAGRQQERKERRGKKEKGKRKKRKGKRINKKGWEMM